MSLGDRLRRVSALGGGQPEGESTPLPTDAQPPLDELVGGEWVTSSGVRCLCVEQHYALSHVHGPRPIGKALDVPADRWEPFVSDGSSIDLTQALFIDTETTGLGRDASTLVFLVGIGYFHGGGFCVRQYLTPSYADEDALLDLLAADIQAHSGLVSFNGRAFDWPLIETRYVLARREPPGDGAQHLDLLHLSRRLWHNALDSCALWSLEQNVLGITREAADVPGWLIPGIYHDYVERGATVPVSRVFYHNAVDILSLVALAAEIGQHIDTPFELAEAPNRDYVALGRLFEKTGRHQDALEAYSRLATSGDPHERRVADKARSLLLKRMGRLGQAADVWRSRLECDELYPYVELAKYLEHRVRDYRGAAEIVSLAINNVRSGAIACEGIEPETLLGELTHRLERVERRASSREAGQGPQPIARSLG